MDEGLKQTICWAEWRMVTIQVILFKLIYSTMTHLIQEISYLALFSKRDEAEDRLVIYLRQ